jgi:hypothetical protein
MNLNMQFNTFNKPLGHLHLSPNKKDICSTVYIYHFMNTLCLSVYKLDRIMNKLNYISDKKLCNFRVERDWLDFNKLLYILLFCILIAV